MGTINRPLILLGCPCTAPILRQWEVHAHRKAAEGHNDLRIDGFDLAFQIITAGGQVPPAADRDFPADGILPHW